MVIAEDDGEDGGDLAKDPSGDNLDGEGDGTDLYGDFEGCKEDSSVFEMPGFDSITEDESIDLAAAK